MKGRVTVVIFKAVFIECSNNWNPLGNAKHNTRLTMLGKLVDPSCRFACCSEHTTLSNSKCGLKLLHQEYIHSMILPPSCHLKLNGVEANYQTTHASNKNINIEVLQAGYTTYTRQPNLLQHRQTVHVYMRMDCRDVFCRAHKVVSTCSTSLTAEVHNGYSLVTLQISCLDNSSSWYIKPNKPWKGELFKICHLAVCCRR